MSTSGLGPGHAGGGDGAEGWSPEGWSGGARWQPVGRALLSRGSLSRRFPAGGARARSEARAGAEAPAARVVAQGVAGGAAGGEVRAGAGRLDAAVSIPSAVPPRLRSFTQHAPAGRQRPAVSWAKTSSTTREDAHPLCLQGRGNLHEVCRGRQQPGAECGRVSWGPAGRGGPPGRTGPWGPTGGPAGLQGCFPQAPRSFVTPMCSAHLQ